jgi:hypothetical protein
MKTVKVEFWDFKGYDERRWFKFLAVNLIIVAILYVGGHIYSNLCGQEFNYEYDSISKEKMTFITQITVDVSIKDPKERVAKLMQYIDNIFNYKIDPIQRSKINRFLITAKPTQIISYLTNTRFMVKSFFWLIGPFVYLEIVFCAVFGVLSSLLFNMGHIIKNSTTDLADPRTTFDSSEVPYQVAKLLYAPICTLAVILGYNFFKDENIADISSSKGVIAFAFICGFYSGRLIALMDRLKEVLLPTEASPIISKSSNSNLAPIKNLSVRVTADLTQLSDEEKTLMGANWLNETEVQMAAINSKTSFKATRSANDALGVFTISDFFPGNYKITASYKKENGAVDIELTGNITGPIRSDNGPIDLVLKKQ